MSDLSTRDDRTAQTEEILELYVAHAPVRAVRLYAYYLSDWEEGVRSEADLLDSENKAAALAALKDDDLETLRAMGFEDPSFFYTVLDAFHLATDEELPKGGGFSCFR